MLTRIRVPVTNTASACVVDTWIQQGWLYAVRYSTASASGFNGATVQLSAIGAASGVASAPQHDILKLTNASVAGLYFPRKEIHTTAGATAASNPLAGMIPLAQEYLRIEIQGGGGTARGVFDLYLQGTA